MTLSFLSDVSAAVVVPYALLVSCLSNPFAKYFATPSPVTGLETVFRPIPSPYQAFALLISALSDNAEALRPLA